MEWKLGHRRWRFWSRVILLICVFCFHSLQSRQENLFSERPRGWTPQHPGALRGSLLNLHTSGKHSCVSQTGSMTIISCHLCGNSGGSSQKAVTFTLNTWVHQSLIKGMQPLEMVFSWPGAAGAEWQMKPLVPTTNLQTGRPLQTGKHLAHLFCANFSQFKNLMIYI